MWRQNGQRYWQSDAHICIYAFGTRAHTHQYCAIHISSRQLQKYDYIITVHEEVWTRKKLAELTNVPSHSCQAWFCLHSGRQSLDACRGRTCLDGEDQIIFQHPSEGLIRLLCLTLLCMPFQNDRIWQRGNFRLGKCLQGQENSRENLLMGASRTLVSISVLTFRLFSTSSSSTTTHYASLCMYDWCQLITVVLVLMPRDHIEIGGWLAPGAMESNERWWGKHWKHGKTIYIYIFYIILYAYRVTVHLRV